MTLILIINKEAKKLAVILSAAKTESEHLMPVSCNPKPNFPGGPLLKRLNAAVAKLQNPSAFQTDHVVMVLVAQGDLITFLPSRKVMGNRHPALTEKIEHPSHRRLADSGIYPVNPFIDLIRRDMPPRGREGVHDDPPLSCRAKPFPGQVF